MAAQPGEAAAGERNKGRARDGSFVAAAVVLPQDHAIRRTVADRHYRLASFVRPPANPCHYYNCRHSSHYSIRRPIEGGLRIPIEGGLRIQGEVLR